MNPEPGLVTETILNPRVLGSVTPASDFDWEAVPPFAATFVKLYDAMVALVDVLTRSMAIVKGTGQLFVTANVMLPLESVALVKLPRLPPL